jgi:putative FmdB family regulatory protein
VPIYEYQCATCGKVTDLKHAFREAPPTTECPSCGASPLKRVFNAAGIVFKGSGFYVNDSRSSKSQSTSAGESKSAGETASTPAPATPTPPKSDAAA